MQVISYNAIRAIYQDLFWENCTGFSLTDSFWEDTSWYQYKYKLSKVKTHLDKIEKNQQKNKCKKTVSSHFNKNFLTFNSQQILFHFLILNFQNFYGINSGLSPPPPVTQGSKVPPFSLSILHMIPWYSPNGDIDKGHFTLDTPFSWGQLIFITSLIGERREAG